MPRRLSADGGGAGACANVDLEEANQALWEELQLKGQSPRALTAEGERDDNSRCGRLFS